MNQMKFVSMEVRLSQLTQLQGCMYGVGEQKVEFIHFLL